MSSSETPTHQGQCFCGAVRIEVRGAPMRMGYCHCSDCRAWAAAPVNGFTLWCPSDVTVTQGAEDLATFAKTPASQRKFCRKCGGHVMSEHPEGGFIDVYSGVLPSLDFRPTFHVYHGESVLEIHDDLPKYAGLPDR